MQELDRQAFDMIVFSGLNDVPFGENIKEYFLNNFRSSPQAWDKVFKGDLWDELDEQARKEREQIVDQALANFDLKRAKFDL